MQILLPSTKTTARAWLSRRAPMQPCAACGDRIPTYGPVVCNVCADAGFCTVCGFDHRPTACPEITEARLHMAAADAYTLRVIAGMNEPL
jgi:hypothetical protein